MGKGMDLTFGAKLARNPSRAIYKKISAIKFANLQENFTAASAQSEPGHAFDNDTYQKQ